MNFDQNGRSKGTAEVILARRQDAMQAIKTYNGVKLDGRPLRIELVGGAPGGVTRTPAAVTVTGVRGGGARRRGGGKKVVAALKVVPRPGTAKAKAQGAGAQGAAAKKKKKKAAKKPAAKAEPLTQAQLDAQLDSYKGAAAMEA